MLAPKKAPISSTVDRLQIAQAMEMVLDRLAELAFAEGRTIDDSSFELSSLVAACARAARHYAPVGGASEVSWGETAGRRWGLKPQAEGRSDAVGSIASEVSVDEDARRVLEWAGLAGILAVDALSLDSRTDIPSTLTRIALPTWAGIGDVDLALRLASENQTVTSSACSISIRLPAGVRGAHMSRLQEAILTVEESPVASPLAAARQMAEIALRSQRAEAARTEVMCRIKLAGTTPLTVRPSPIVISVRAGVEMGVDGTALGSLGIGFGVMTACPCTIRYSQLRAESVAGAVAAELPPTFTHSQPGQLELTLEGSPEELPDVRLITRVIEGVAHLRRAVLKRPDEHVLVERAHRFPQFTEDLARSATLAVAAHVAASTRIRTTASLSESIHPHSATSTVEAVASQLWSQP